MDSTNPTPIEPTNYTVMDSGYFEQRVANYIESLRHEQNLGFAILAGSAAAIIGALLWAAVSVATGYQFGYAAIGLGFLVGFAMRYAGKGFDKIFGYIGAGLALLGCVLGNFFSTIGFIANELNISSFQVLAVVDLNMAIDLMKESFSFMDIIFYGIAAHSGYKYAFRQLSEEEWAMLGRQEDNSSTPAKEAEEA